MNIETANAEINARVSARHAFYQERFMQARVERGEDHRTLSEAEELAAARMACANRAERRRRHGERSDGHLHPAATFKASSVRTRGR